MESVPVIAGSIIVFEGVGPGNGSFGSGCKRVPDERKGR